MPNNRDDDFTETFGRDCWIAIGVFVVVVGGIIYALVELPL